MTDKVINAIVAAGGVAVGTMVTFFARGRTIKDRELKMTELAAENTKLQEEKEGLMTEVLNLRSPPPTETPNPEQPQAS